MGFLLVTRWGGWCLGSQGNNTVALVWAQGGEGCWSGEWCRALSVTWRLFPTSLRLQALRPGTSTLSAFGSRAQDRHTQFRSPWTWIWRGKWLFLLALDSADQLALSYCSALMTLPLQRRMGWGRRRGEGTCVPVCLSVCLSACHGRRGCPVEGGCLPVCFWVVRNEPKVSLQDNSFITLIMLVCDFQRWEEINFFLTWSPPRESFPPLYLQITLIQLSFESRHSPYVCC